MDSLFYSVKIEGGVLNNKLLTFRDFKRPFANLTRQLVDSIKKDSKRTEEFQRKLMPIAISYAKEANKKILNLLDTTNITTLKLAGLFYSNDANFGQLPRELVEKNISGIEIGKNLLLKNLMSPHESINRVGTKLPTVTLPKPNNKKVSLYQINGEFKVLDFWASWCGPCRKANRVELPKFNKYLFENHIPLISISIDTDKQKWKQAVKTDAPTWEQLIDDQNIFTQVLHIQGIPQYLVLNKENVVVFESNVLFSIKNFIEMNIRVKAP
jgi:thiol-disulfide isomerase/thioredoxin